MQRLIEVRIRMPKRNFIASRVLLCRSMYVRQYEKYIKSIQYSVKLMIKLTYRNLPQQFSASASQGDLVVHYGSKFQRVPLNLKPRCCHVIVILNTFDLFKRLLRTRPSNVLLNNFSREECMANGILPTASVRTHIITLITLQLRQSGLKSWAVVDPGQKISFFRQISEKCRLFNGTIFK